MKPSKLMPPKPIDGVFITIDDLSKLAGELVYGLNKLGEQKYPLSVRRGVKNMDGKILKTASKTYFFDIKKTREGKPYLVITESRIKSKERNSIVIFQENIAAFAEMVTTLAQGF